MKRFVSFILITFTISAVFSGLVNIEAYAQSSKGCSCCDSGGCRKEKCNENSKNCICSSQSSLKPFTSLLSVNYLYLPVSYQYSFQSCYPGYAYLFLEDIFHPPREI